MLSLQHTNFLSPVAQMTKSCQETPLSLLPNEILSDIILLSAVPLDIFVWKSPILSISATWRACALDTPRLWSCIHVTGKTHASERLACWIQRSGDGCPLHLIVHNLKAFRALETSWLTPDSIPNAGRRIHSLMLATMDQDENAPLPLYFDATNLRDLDIFTVGLMFRDLTPHPFFCDAPSICLKRLRLSCSFPSSEWVAMRMLDAFTLTTLILSGEFSCHDILDITIRAPLLEQLECDIKVESADADESPQPLVKCDSLRRLMLRGKTTAVDLLRIIETPSLQRFFVSGGWRAEELLQIIQFSAKCRKLTHLKINAIDKSLSAPQVAALLYALPRLEYIDLKWDQYNIKGLLALCGEFPKSTAKSHANRPWACRNVSRFQLPLSRLEIVYPHGRRYISKYLKRIIDVRGPRKPLDIGNSILERPGNDSPRPLIFVVDVPHSTLSSIVGDEWIASRMECVNSLEFPGVL
ncbi:hypothetical protein DL93DRAFT_2153577 [Clavulina sp. PMI_390]|nr:hypothetical protein DL93DRAFT_2153577 [Clavulina sp. PMI_390]